MAGAYEASNVNVVEEMVNLIEAQRAFEVTSKQLLLWITCCRT